MARAAVGPGSWKLCPCCCPFSPPPPSSLLFLPGCGVSTASSQREVVRGQGREKQQHGAISSSLALVLLPFEWRLCLHCAGEWEMLQWHGHSFQPERNCVGARELGSCFRTTATPPHLVSVYGSLLAGNCTHTIAGDWEKQWRYGHSSLRHGCSMTLAGCRESPSSPPPPPRAHMH